MGIRPHILNSGMFDQQFLNSSALHPPQEKQFNTVHEMGLVGYNARVEIVPSIP